MSDYTPAGGEIFELFADKASRAGKRRITAHEEFVRWLRAIKATAWEEGAEEGWRRSGDGWNGEYAAGTHDGSKTFRDLNPEVQNPYRSQLVKEKQ